MFMMRVPTFFLFCSLFGCVAFAQDLSTDDRSGLTLPADIIIDELGGGELFAPSKVPENEAESSVASASEFLMSAGMEYADEGEYEAAERAYLRALEDDPDDSELLFRLSTLYTKMDRYGDAVEILKRRVELSPENPLLHNNLSWCYSTGMEVFNPEKALWHAREALLFAPHQASVWNTLAEAYYVLGDYEKALRSAEEAVDSLAVLNPSEEQFQSYKDQRVKIIRASNAVKMLEDIGSE
jgi:tetratricopeptide (TPR) repeat protein